MELPNLENPVGGSHSTKSVVSVRFVFTFLTRSGNASQFSITESGSDRKYPSKHRHSAAPLDDCELRGHAEQFPIPSLFLYVPIGQA